MMDKLKLPLIIIGVVIALVIFFQVKSCITENNIAKISKLEGRLVALTEEAEKEKQELRQLKKESDDRIEILKGAISELTEKTQEYREEIETKDSELKGLKSQFSLIAEEDKDGQILNLQAQVSNLEIQLTKAVKGWDAAEAKAVGWEKAFNLKDGYCAELEAYLETKDNLLRIAKEVNTQKDKKIARLKLGKTVERIIVYPFAGYGAFKLVQGVLK